MRNTVSIPATGTSFPPIAGAGEAGDRPDGFADATEEDAAVYLFDLLVGARRLATSRRQKFLAYLIGMAVEEARLLTMGRSAADAPGKTPPLR